MQGMSGLEVPSTPIVFVLFGATGDLAKRMVLPAFYTLARQNLLPQDYFLSATVAATRRTRTSRRTCETC